MEIKSINDLKSMDPNLLKKLQLKKVSCDDIAKLGLQIFNAGDFPRLSTRPFQADEFTNKNLKNFYTNESVEQWLKNFIQKEQPNQKDSVQNFHSNSVTGSTAFAPDRQVDKSKSTDQTTAPEEPESKEKGRIIRRRPYPRRGWPFLWGHPFFHRARINSPGVDPKQEEGDKNLSQGSSLPEKKPEPAPIQTGKEGQNAGTADLPEGKNEKENVSEPFENSSGDQGGLQEAELNLKNNSENEADVTGGVLINDNEGLFEEEEEERNTERVFQLESIKSDIEIKNNLCRIVTLNVLNP